MFQDILNRLQACEASLSDIEILGSAADNTMILESGEPEDIYKEIELRREFIRHVQLIAREKKPRIYGLMVYSFLQRFDELNKLLTNIEDGVNDEKGVNQDIQAVLEQMRNNEVIQISHFVDSKITMTFFIMHLKKSPLSFKDIVFLKLKSSHSIPFSSMT